MASRAVMSSPRVGGQRTGWLISHLSCSWLGYILADWFRIWVAAGWAIYWPIDFDATARTINAAGRPSVASAAACWQTRYKRENSAAGGKAPSKLEQNRKLSHLLIRNRGSRQQYLKLSRLGADCIIVKPKQLVEKFEETFAMNAKEAMKAKDIIDIWKLTR